MDRSEPQDGEVLDQAPKEVVAWFSEELDSSQSMMLILDAQKQQVDNGDGGVDLDDLDHKSMIVSLRPSLPEGTYTVRWVAVSVEDGDSTEGEFTFSVGNSIQLEEPAKPSRSSASIWLYGGMALVLIFGGVIAASFIRRSWRGQ